MPQGMLYVQLAQPFLDAVTSYKLCLSHPTFLELIPVATYMNMQLRSASMLVECYIGPGVAHECSHREPKLDPQTQCGVQGLPGTNVKPVTITPLALPDLLMSQQLQLRFHLAA